MGILHWDGQEVKPKILKRMADTLIHRGPDEQGFFFNKKPEGNEISADAFWYQSSSYRYGKPVAAAGLAHRRLSIIDLPSGRQPLSNEDGMVWIVFNGEIYNFKELRAILTKCGHCFKTNSDTEVIIHAYEEWGTNCLHQLNGMFAFAIWDQRQELLFLGRDRIGKKPLYYHASDGKFLFGSELKALLAYPGVETQIDLTAVADYFKYLYIPDPKSIFAGINKLSPAHFLVATKRSVVIKQYWDVHFEGTSHINESVLADQLFDLLGQAVRDRMVADVPLGAFLSGGIDSSGVVALMSRQSEQPIVTCSIGFDDPEHDESRYAAQVAHYLGTSHHEFFVRENFLDTVRRIPFMFDEPFADASALPTYYVCKMARQRVTVALSGDGGDETFAGYDKYLKDAIEQLVSRFVPIPFLYLINKACIGRSNLQRKGRTLTSQALRDPDRAFYETNTIITDRELDNLFQPEIRNQIKGYDPSQFTRQFFNSINTDDRLTRILYTDLKTSLP
ncbi:MAG: asparagine synthase (glutamine-hydrolyzing), partial [Nitrosomonas ureae]